MRMDLRTYLDAHQMDLAAFASKICVTKEAVRLWLAGDRMPRPEMMQRIMKTTDGLVTPNDFIGALPQQMREVV